MTEPADSDELIVPAPSVEPERRRAPRPRRIPRSREQQARLDVREPAFEPVPFALDDAAAHRPFADKLSEWFTACRWQLFDFQREVWAEIGRGASGLLHATTGAGKTWAVWVSVHGALPKALIVDTVIPGTIERFFLGAAMWACARSARWPMRSAKRGLRSSSPTPALNAF